MNATMQSSDILPLIRRQVRTGLLRSEAYRALAAPKRAEIAHHTVNAIHYIVAGADGRTRPSAVTVSGNTPLAGALAGTSSQKPPDPAGDTAGQRFREAGGGVASREGADTLADLVNKVNFPKFVGGLIDGVFNSIVTTSIKQMEAYAEMVKNVSKSVDQYMKDNVSENHARDYLLDRYPDQFEPNMGGDKPTLKAKQGADEQNMPDFFADLGMKAPVTSLDDDTVEQELVPAARRRIAMDRQQLLATMIMMGINRLVVTDGRIEASCMFELNVKQKDDRSRESTGDYGTHHEDGSNRGYSGSDQYDYKQEGPSGGWFS